MKYVKENYFEKGITDEVAILAHLEARAMPVTTVNLTMAIERLRAAASPADRPAGSPPTVAQVKNAEDAPNQSATYAACYELARLRVG